MNRAKRIDQHKRDALCRRILNNDNGAIVELASLYYDAGYRSLGECVVAMTRSQAQNHARVVLGGRQ